MASEFLDLMFKPSVEDTRVLDKNIRDLRAEQEAGTRRVDHGFQLATALISHNDRRLVQEGVQILEALSFQYWQAARGEASSPTPDAAVADRDSGTTRLVECCFYLSIGQAKLGDTVKARSSVEKLLSLSPKHPQGLALRERLENDLFDSGVKGLLGVSLAILGVGIAVAAGLRSSGSARK